MRIIKEGFEDDFAARVGDVVEGEGDNLFTARDNGERPTFLGFKDQAHGGKLLMNFILEFLMLGFVPGDDLKIISEGGGDDLSAIEVVARFVFVELDEGDDGLEDDEEDNGAQGITLELEDVGGPIFGDYLAL